MHTMNYNNLCLLRIAEWGFLFRTMQGAPNPAFRIYYFPGPKGPGGNSSPGPSGIPSPELGAGPGEFALMEMLQFPKSAAAAAIGQTNAKTIKNATNFFMKLSFRV
jgi:hypothetical protein